MKPYDMTVRSPLSHPTNVPEKNQVPPSPRPPPAAPAGRRAARGAHGSEAHGRPGALHRGNGVMWNGTVIYDVLMMLDGLMV